MVTTFVHLFKNRQIRRKIVPMNSPDNTRPGTHPVLECAAVIGSSLKSVADVNPAFMTTTDKRAALLELTDLGSQLESLRLRVIAACDDVAADCDQHWLVSTDALGAVRHAVWRYGGFC